MKQLSKLASFASLVRKVLALSAPYFRSEEKRKASGLLAAIVLLNLAAVYMLVQINDWNRLFYDALQNKDEPVFWQQLLRFGYLAVAYIIIAVYKFYLTQLLEMRWRAWMTQHTLQRWLAGHAFYQLELARFGGGLQTPPDNPDQRIQEDLNLFTSYSIGLSMGLLNALVTLVSFVGILWSLSGGFSFAYNGEHYEIAGFMVWMAVLYCLAGSVATHAIGRPQIALNFQQQRYEADFRHHLVRVRESSEAIALDRGEAFERQHLGERFASVLANYLRLLKAQKNLVWFTNFFGQAAVVFPFVVAAPRFFSGAIQLGELMQIASAFGRVQESLAWFVDNYSTLASWRATLTSDAADIAGTADTALTAHTADTASNGGELSTLGLTLTLPGGTTLLSSLALSLRVGDMVLLQGPSGSGKSTLFRAFAGIWPFARGAIHRPADFAAQSMFIPQRPYLPQGTLRAALAYPGQAGDYSDSALRQALTAAQLPHWAHRLDEHDAWGQKLSGGEQQRLALARVFLKQPRWVFADEATSALDEATEQAVYRNLLDHLRSVKGALVSIAHRPALAAFHQRRWTLQKQPAGAPAQYRLHLS
jgi:vitamin B12/bleomycin/antimicrobial peptide transport system ATP-binding/permease protein